MKTQRICVLGSTGSIGKSTLDVIARNPERFEVVALTANRNTDLLARQCAQFNARLAVVADASRVPLLTQQLQKAGSTAEILTGEEGLVTVAGLPEIDTVMAAIVGAAGLAPTFRAAEAGKKILLANKESLVIAGQVFVAEAKRNGARVLPVDSEHNAIFQSLPPEFTDGLDGIGVEKVILTASGGPFLDTPADALSAVTPEQACAHPNWDMGRKISVDSATLMNKGLEVIEARWLFNARPEQIEVLVHPQSIVHSMVSYRDGSVIAQLGTPDMRTPIANVLAWPERIAAGVRHLDLAQINDLSFHKPDFERFPCLSLAFAAMRQGGGAPAALNAANEVAVELFLERRIGFDRIAGVVEETLKHASSARPGSLEQVMEQDRLARNRAHEYAAKIS